MSSRSQIEGGSDTSCGPLKLNKHGKLTDGIPVAVFHTMPVYVVGTLVSKTRAVRGSLTQSPLGQEESARLCVTVNSVCVRS